MRQSKFKNKGPATPSDGNHSGDCIPQSYEKEDVGDITLENFDACIMQKPTLSRANTKKLNALQQAKFDYYNQKNSM